MSGRHVPEVSIFGRAALPTMITPSILGNVQKVAAVRVVIGLRLVWERKAVLVESLVSPFWVGSSSVLREADRRCWLNGRHSSAIGVFPPVVG